MPLWVNFGEPTILNLNTPNDSWARYLDVVTRDPPPNNWVYLAILGHSDRPAEKENRKRKFVLAAHPIHLHGHDFAILAQSNKTFPGWENVKNLTLNNPPRRDVALLPSNGYLIIAFKADNPGTWLLHCHIAWHASSGLGFQVLENAEILSKRFDGNPDIQNNLINTCNSWDDWVRDEKNHWDPHHRKAFQDDSGV